jgi:WXG100 family type VII secretion target
MPASVVRTNHEELKQIAQLFDQEADAIGALLQNISQAKSALQGGGWVGKAATAFQQELDSSVLPSLKRLQRALEQAQQTSQAIATRMRRCETDAAQQLQDREDFTILPVGGSDGSLPGGEGVSIGQPVGGSGGSLPGGEGVSIGQPVGGSGGSLPGGEGVSIGQPVGGSGGSLPGGEGVSIGQPVGGSGGSLPGTGEIGIPGGEMPSGGSGGSLPGGEGDWSIGGEFDLGPISGEGSIGALRGSITDDPGLGGSVDGEVLGSDLTLSQDVLGLWATETSLSGEASTLGGSAGIGLNGGLQGAFVEVAGGQLAVEGQIGGGEDGWFRQDFAIDVVAVDGFVGHHDSDFGLGGSATLIGASNAWVLGTKNLGLTFGVEANGPQLEGSVGKDQGQFGLQAGASLVGISGEAGLNLFGYNVSLGAGAGIEFGLGAKGGLGGFETREGPVKFGLSFGDAK